MERTSCCPGSRVSPTCAATRKSEPTVTLKKEEAVKAEVDVGVKKSCCSISHVSSPCGATRKTKPTVTVKKEEAVKAEANAGVNANAMKPAKIEEKVIAKEEVGSDACFSK